MPQNGMASENRRRGTRHNTCKANGQVPGTGLVNGAVVHNGWAGADTRTSGNTTAGTFNDTKPKFVVNGYINHGFKSKSVKSVPPRTVGKHGSTISAVADASAAGRDRSVRTPAGSSVNGAISLDTAASLCNSDQMSSQPSLSTKENNQRRKARSKQKKSFYRGWPENQAPPAMPPVEEENWENEILDVKVTDWEKLNFGVTPYDPQDVIHFSLRDLTLKQRDTVDLPVTANYSPAVHHRRPLRWSCFNSPTEPDQFADADE
ncbi:uncharacterized protein LOC131963672 [Centropristis striata]|uniref:uncharacterized protein LOC131963672 n=1 Tax=Centropristis striata TaxID=184440 RepID=UPI0027E05CFB|nr:uncharacterized protein LOC131963672 [Centropristis striata]